MGFFAQLRRRGVLKIATIERAVDEPRTGLERDARYAPLLKCPGLSVPVGGG